MLLLQHRVREAALLIVLALALTPGAALATETELPDGSTYTGELADGRLHGEGRLEWPRGDHYEGGFDQGLMHGHGRLQTHDGRIYEGRFERGVIVHGSYADDQGAHYEGGLQHGRFHGEGVYTDTAGNRYSGVFEDGDLSGAGEFRGADGRIYGGAFRDWLFHGQGRLQHPNGDVYEGRFRYGQYHGEGTLTYAEPRDGRSQDSGSWAHGYLPERMREERDAARRGVESALYAQHALLAQALDGIAVSDPERISLYLLAVAGDGTQEVFRREVQSITEMMDRDFNTAGRSVALINSRSTFSSAPMATATSVERAVSAIAGRMDRDKDILFLYLTSHGSPEHELTLAQNGMELPDLSAATLSGILRDSDIRWKVVVVSACYSGGFIDHLKDAHTLVITAARHDRASFGCRDENDYTYFGRAYFEDALPRTRDFHTAFSEAERIVLEREAEEGIETHSLPQVNAPQAILDHLSRWREAQ